MTSAHSGFDCSVSLRFPWEKHEPDKERPALGSAFISRHLSGNQWPSPATLHRSVGVRLHS